jgi:hypothetical protein
MAVFDPNKVRSEWRDEYNGKYGWFSDCDRKSFYGDRNNIECYVRDDNKGMYGECSKGSDRYPFHRSGKVNYNFFYLDEHEEESMEFDKANLFIAGYNDGGLKNGDLGHYGVSVENIKRCIEKEYTPASFNGFNENGVVLFYRTKCAPQKRYIPWTDETVPNDLLGKTVLFKEDNKKRGIITWVGGGVTVANTDYSFNVFMSVFVMSDGTPCGQEVEE